MKLTLNGIKSKSEWEKSGIMLPKHNIEKMINKTKSEPVWLHFGAGNIFRIFLGSIGEKMLSEGKTEKGIICAEAFDFDIIDEIYKPFDNLVMGITLKADGNTKKEVIASVAEAVKADNENKEDFERLKEIFKAPTLQLVSFTITEKGYALRGTGEEYFPFIKADIENGPEKAKSAVAIVCGMLNERYKSGKMPLAVVSMDNCSKNGDKLKNAVIEIAKKWLEKGYVEEGFIDYLESEKITFPWTMIDKITPRPDSSIAQELKKDGVEGMDIVVTKKNTYIAPFVNAEEPGYLVIEDSFPNGRPPFECAGVYMADRQTVDKTEKMKVTACLNPLHTALAVYGCLLGYKLISDEMKDKELKGLVEKIGLKEGLPVVEDPGIISPEVFVREVIEERMSNPFIPDSPQRIATDTSQKVGIRYGQTIKSYVDKYASADKLEGIPLAIAGWLRYLIAIDDDGKELELSADPMLDELKNRLRGIKVEAGADCGDLLRPILSDEKIFGINLYSAGIGNKIEGCFNSLIQGKGAVRATLKKYAL